MVHECVHIYRVQLFKYVVVFIYERNALKGQRRQLTRVLLYSRRVVWGAIAQSISIVIREVKHIVVEQSSRGATVNWLSNANPKPT